MYRKAADFLLEVCNGGLAVLHTDGVFSKLNSEISQVSHCARNVIGGDGNMPIGSAAAAVKRLNAIAYKARTTAGIERPTEQQRKALCGCKALVRIRAVYADMANFKAQHEIYRTAGQFLNARKVPRLNKLRFDHPASATRYYLIARQILAQVLFVYAAGGHKTHLTIRCGYSLYRGKAAHLLGREELDYL